MSLKIKLIIIVLCLFVTHNSLAFSGPPPGCTPLNCNNGPLSELIPENIKEGIIIGNVEGTVKTHPNCVSNGEISCVSNSSYTSSYNRGSINIQPSPEAQSFPPGYYNNSNVNGDPDLKIYNIKPGINVFGIENPIESPLFRKPNIFLTPYPRIKIDGGYYHMCATGISNLNALGNLLEEKMGYDSCDPQSKQQALESLCYNAEYDMVTGPTNFGGDGSIYRDVYCTNPQ